MSNTMIIVQAL